MVNSEQIIHSIHRAGENQILIEDVLPHFAEKNSVPRDFEGKKNPRLKGAEKEK